MKTAIIDQIKGKCKFKGCRRNAGYIAAGRERDYITRPVSIYCETHAELIANQLGPEYTVDCPNCGCKFGVN